MSRMNRRVVVLSGIMATFALAASPAPPTTSPAPVLKVSTHSGRAPLSLGMKGDLGSVPAGDLKGCRLRVDRLYTSPGGIQTSERAEYPCGPRSDEPIETATFDKTLVLEEPGDYTLRIIVTPAGGRELAGMTQDVKVYHRLEVGGTATRTPN